MQWIAQCARRLREQWPRVDLALLEEIALELWRDERFAAIPGERAAAVWLAPLVCQTTVAGTQEGHVAAPR